MVSLKSTYILEYGTKKIFSNFVFNRELSMFKFLSIFDILSLIIQRSKWPPQEEKVNLYLAFSC